MKTLVLALISLISVNSLADINWNQLAHNLERAGGHSKALSHIQCFVESNTGKPISLKQPDNQSYNNRCYAKEALSLTKTDQIILIDYTLPGTKRRFFLLDTKTNQVKALGVAHGRYKSGYVRFFTRHNKNSLKWAKYFSNERGSNAPSSGFFFAGQEYHGKFGRSLILHGLEPGINDYACERAVVIHKHWAVSKKRAYSMSSGCPMVNSKFLDEVIKKARGKQSGIKIEEAGSLVFIYGPRERQWDNGQCMM